MTTDDERDEDAATLLQSVQRLVMTYASAPRLRQDAPIQADVWINFAAAAGAPVALLFVPYRDMTAGDAAHRLREALTAAGYGGVVASVQGVIAARLTIEAFLTCVVPATDWWMNTNTDTGAMRWLVEIASLLSPGTPIPGTAPTPFVGFVSTDRPIRTAAASATASAMRSIVTVKADAALRLFGIACKRITWAVLDTGIDATHPAFRDHDPEAKAKAKAESKPPPVRVDTTYDFVGILDRIASIVDGDDRAATAAIRHAATLSMKALKPELDAAGLRRAVTSHFIRLRKRLREGRDLDWQLFEPFVLAVEPRSPASDHGTSVAGIIGADWQPDEDDQSSPSTRPPMIGMCPDIRLIDVRVVPDDAGATSSEFDVIAALQFLRFLNDRSDAKRVEVHGANLSLATPHDVRNYACGATLVCVECDRLSANGVVVVAAAGNGGYSADLEGAVPGVGGRYAAISIADPGNAASVITVGSTHATEPHRYGVSWFSGRGPTGDGRMKPDLLAPGERIVAPRIDLGSTKEVNGTSFAAPHVSGAAALLMARHQELVGKPARIKEILVRTATDLGRERSFQGAGVLDVLRALQHP